MNVIDKLEVIKLFAKGEINLNCLYLLLCKNFDGFVCLNTSCQYCGDRIIPQNNQSSTKYCEPCWEHVHETL
jgi:hypothetical protein